MSNSDREKYDYNLDRAGINLLSSWIRCQYDKGLDNKQIACLIEVETGTQYPMTRLRQFANCKRNLPSSLRVFLNTQMHEVIQWAICRLAGADFASKIDSKLLAEHLHTPMKVVD